MCLLSGLPPHINQGNASVLREYIYVEDVVAGYLLVAEKIPEIYGENNKNMPKYGKETCRYCDLSSLCRIKEKL